MEIPERADYAPSARRRQQGAFMVTGYALWLGMLIYADRPGGSTLAGLGFTWRRMAARGRLPLAVGPTVTSGPGMESEP